MFYPHNWRQVKSSVWFSVKCGFKKISLIEVIKYHGSEHRLPGFKAQFHYLPAENLGQVIEPSVLLLAHL